MAKSYQRRDARVRQIAQATLELIAESGLRAFTSKAIAQKVGITDGTIFRHFKNKEDIVLAAMELLEETMYSEAFPDDDDPLLRLEKFFRMRAALLGGQAAMGRLMFSEQLVHAAGEAGRVKLAEWRARNIDFVMACLDQLNATNDLPEGLAPRDLRVVIQGTLLTFAFERMLDGGDRDLEQRIEACWQTLSHLLVPGTPTRDS